MQLMVLDTTCPFDARLRVWIRRVRAIGGSVWPLGVRLSRKVPG